MNENSQKQIIQKIFEKKKNASTVFLGLGYMHHGEKKTIENQIFVGAGARKVESLVRFLSNFDPLFFQYSESTKKVQNIY